MQVKPRGPSRNNIILLLAAATAVLVAGCKNGVVKLDSAARREMQRCPKPPASTPPPGEYADHGVALDYSKLAPLPDPTENPDTAYLQRVVADPGSLEQIYYDATHGNAQAAWLTCVLEATARFGGRRLARELAGLKCQLIVDCSFEPDAGPFSTDMASGYRLLTFLGEAFEAEATRLKLEQDLLSNALMLVVGARLAVAQFRVPPRALPPAKFSARSDVWSRPPVVRGRAIEKALGANLPKNFPIIDRFKDGVATSIKSLDLGAKSYQNARVLSRTVKRYIDRVAGFNGQEWARRRVLRRHIKGRALDLVVPGTGSAAQQQALQSLVQYGKTVGVQVNVIVFP